MTPSEKAQEIYNKHYMIASEYCEEIQCSLIAKKCALAEIDGIFGHMKLDDEKLGCCHNANSEWVNFYLEVKNELEKL